MTAYAPFLIAPFQTGLATDIAPWLLPEDAFSDIVNGRINHGVLQKRHGYVKQGDIVHQHQTNWKITNIETLNPARVTLVASTGLTAGDVIEIRNVTGMTQVNDERYVVAFDAGDPAGAIRLFGVDATAGYTAYAGLGDVYLVPGNPVMGLGRYVDSDNVKEVIAFDTKRAARYDPTNRVYNPLDSADIMNSGDTNYVCTCNWSSTADSASTTLYRMYFTNGMPLAGGLNGIRYYNDAATTTSYAPSINGVTTINGCKLLFAWKSVLLLLHTFEGTNTYPQRARWCEPMNPDGAEAWYDNRPGHGDFVDCPTGDHIISAQFIQDTLIVFFTNSIWSLSYTANPNGMFRWKKINDFRACDGKMASEGFDNQVISVGTRGIVSVDGVQSQRIDDRISNFVDDDINSGEFGNVFMKRNFGGRNVWMLYPNGDSDDANAALIFDEDSKSFSKYLIDMNVLGYGGPAKDSAIDDFADMDLEDFGDLELDDYYFDNGAEVLLGGNRTGEVFIMEYGPDDAMEPREYDVVGATAASPCVITLDAIEGIANGDVVSVADVGGIGGINDQFFTVANLVDNSFELEGSTSTGVYTTGGYVFTYDSTAVDFEMTSAGWNPFIKEGKKCQMGYLDILFDTNANTEVDIDFFVNNEMSKLPISKRINLLPNINERCTIAGITNASPGVVSANSHGLSTGDVVYIYGVDGMSTVNGLPYTVTLDTVDPENRFSIGVDTTTYGAYTGGGIVTDNKFFSDKVWKRVYCGAIGHQHKVVIRTAGKNTILRIHAMTPWFRPVSSRPM